MDVQYARCCGLDVHQKTVVACVLVTASDGTVQRTVRTFGTMTADLLALNDWLNAQQVGQVALESTGVYWRPVFNLLEADHPIILVNARAPCSECRGARPTSRTASGWRTCCAMAYSRPASSRRSPSASCGS